MTVLLNSVRRRQKRFFGLERRRRQSPFLGLERSCESLAKQKRAEFSRCFKRSTVPRREMISGRRISSCSSRSRRDQADAAMARSGASEALRGASLAQRHRPLDRVRERRQIPHRLLHGLRDPAQAAATMLNLIRSYPIC